MSQSPDVRSIEAPPGSEIAIVQAFVRAKAQSETSARSLEALGLELTPAIEELRARGFLYRAIGETWYLDMPRYLARRFRRRVLIFGTGALLLLLTWILVRAL
jgi:hypothetical protein